MSRRCHCRRHLCWWQPLRTHARPAPPSTSAFSGSTPDPTSSLTARENHYRPLLHRHDRKKIMTPFSPAVMPLACTAAASEPCSNPLFRIHRAPRSSSTFVCVYPSSRMQSYIIANMCMSFNSNKWKFDANFAFSLIFSRSRSRSRSRAAVSSAAASHRSDPDYGFRACKLQLQR